MSDIVNHIPQDLAGATILVVDDNPENLRVISDCLGSAGFQVLVARDGGSALEKTGYAHPDLILMDVVMPRMDGFDACSKLKSDEALRNIPVIFMTALDDIQSKINGFRAGGVDYIAKPLQQEELLARVTTHLDLSRKRLELVKALDRLRATQSRLIRSERIAALSHLIAGLAHELNTPIGNCVLAASFVDRTSTQILGQGVPVSRERFFESVSDIQKMSALMMQNLDHINVLMATFQEVSAQRSPRTRTAINLRKAFDDTLEMMGISSENSRLSVQVDCNDGLAVRGDQGLFSEIIVNLVSNALDYAYVPDERASIRVSAKVFDTSARIIFADDGKGMDRQTLANIFEPFPSMIHPVEHRGLGLYIVYNIVTRQFGGTIECKSSPGHGTVFDIVLPLADSSEPERQD